MARTIDFPPNPPGIGHNSTKAPDPKDGPGPNIHKLPRDYTGFYQRIPSELIESKSITSDALAVYVYLQNQSANWRITIKGVAARFGWTNRRAGKAFACLSDNGLMSGCQARSDGQKGKRKGTFGAQSYALFALPSEDLPGDVSPPLCKNALTVKNDQDLRENDDLPSRNGQNPPLYKNALTVERSPLCKKPRTVNCTHTKSKFKTNKINPTTSLPLGEAVGGEDVNLNSITDQPDQGNINKSTETASSPEIAETPNPPNPRQPPAPQAELFTEDAAPSGIVRGRSRSNSGYTGQAFSLTQAEVDRLYLDYEKFADPLGVSIDHAICDADDFWAEREEKVRNPIAACRKNIEAKIRRAQKLADDFGSGGTSSRREWLSALEASLDDDDDDDDAYFSGLTPRQLAAIEKALAPPVSSPFDNPHGIRVRMTGRVR